MAIARTGELSAPSMARAIGLTSSRRVRGKEFLHGLARRRLVLGFLPALDEGGIGGERGELSRRGFGVVQVVPEEDEEWRLTTGDELARHVEEELAAVHRLLEGLPGGFAHLRARGLELVRPAVEHFEERLAVAVEADRLEHDSGRHAVRRRLDQPHDVRAADAHAREMAAADAQMIEQGEMIRRV